MNKIDFIIVALCKGSTALAALVATRFYPVGNVPQADTLTPFIVFGTEEEPLQDKDGDLTTFQGKFQVDIYGEVQSEIKTIGEILETIFQNYTGTTGSVKVDDIQSLGKNPPEFDTDYQLFVQSVEFNYFLQVI